MRVSTATLSLCSLLLLASVTANFALFSYAKQYYKEANATRLDPTGTNYYSSTVLPKDSSNKLRVVFLGDSRAKAWPNPKQDSTNIRSKHYQFINRGISSQTSSQVLQRFAAHVVPLKPDVIVLQVGINDLKTIALFPERAWSIQQDYKANIAQLVMQSQKTADVVIISTILPAGKISLARRPFWSADVDAAVVEANLYLKQLVEETRTKDRDDALTRENQQRADIIFFDGFSVVAGENGKMNASYQLDELHMNPAGYNALNQDLLLHLEETAARLMPP